jgi:hypothetical protein
MNSSNSRPKWWQLYLTFPLLLVLFIIDHRLNIPTREHEPVQIGIILFVYGLIYWWIKANSRAISRIDQQQYYGKVRVIQIHLLQFSEANDERSPMFQLPDSEVKGMLSNTFEIEADTSMVDQASSQLNKE